MPNSAIEATLSFYREWERGPLALYHMRYRGFAAFPHSHEVVQILVPLNGRMHMVAAGRSHMLGPESAIWIPADLTHSFVHVDGQVDFVAIEIDMAAMPLQPALAAIGKEQLLVSRAANLKLLGQAAANELDAPGEGSDRLLAACAEMVLVYLERSLAPDAGQTEASSPEVAMVIEAILAGYSENLRVPQLAAMVGLSPRQLERRFNEELGRTPKRFMMEVRVSAAENMLRNTDLSIAQIALDVGFQTPSHFTETFKTLTGRLPNSVRTAEMQTVVSQANLAESEKVNSIA